jgi:hypothetical protein
MRSVFLEDRVRGRCFRLLRKPVVGLAVLATFFMGGCTPKMGPSQGVPVPSEDPSMKALWASAHKIRTALEILKEKEGVQGPQHAIPEPTDNALTTLVTMRAWNGPARQAVEYIGFLIGYTVTEIGEGPAIPPLVSIHVTNEKAHYVLQSIAQQISGIADVIIREQKKEIILRYNKRS